MSQNEDEYTPEEFKIITQAALDAIAKETARRCHSLDEIVESYSRLFNAAICLACGFDPMIVSFFEPIIDLKSAAGIINLYEITDTPLDTLDNVLVPGTDKFNKFIEEHPEVFDSPVGKIVEKMLKENGHDFKSKDTQPVKKETLIDDEDFFAELNKKFKGVD